MARSMAKGKPRCRPRMMITMSCGVNPGVLPDKVQQMRTSSLLSVLNSAHRLDVLKLTGKHVACTIRVTHGFP